MHRGTVLNGTRDKANFVTFTEGDEGYPLAATSGTTTYDFHQANGTEPTGCVTCPGVTGPA
ncbi:hypothetical protein [Granulicella mallensis]|uniref:Uncharacterized protein n=1 Tax=Granulicella mallensis TaxID=940614 RepID=A0A7W8EDB9_9BACT|nr:hypothetical protein [Granulicella mallensis]MBB5066545.1 hypothetical protein [Granulicella mallensis]